MLRRMIGVIKKDWMRNKEVRRRTGVEESIAKVVERQKWRWHGHIVQKGDGDILKRAMEEPVRGKRNRGRQLTR